VTCDPCLTMAAPQFDNPEMTLCGPGAFHLLWTLHFTLISPCLDPALTLVKPWPSFLVLPSSNLSEL
jgi:hypothetical protein